VCALLWPRLWLTYPNKVSCHRNHSLFLDLEWRSPELLPIKNGRAFYGLAYQLVQSLCHADQFGSAPYYSYSGKVWNGLSLLMCVTSLFVPCMHVVLGILLCMQIGFIGTEFFQSYEMCGLRLWKWEIFLGLADVSARRCSPCRLAWAAQRRTNWYRLLLILGSGSTSLMWAETWHLIAKIVKIDSKSAEMNLKFHTLERWYVSKGRMIAADLFPI